MANINLTLPLELLEQIDEARGDVPRTVWIRRAIEHRLDVSMDLGEPAKSKEGPTP
jgi:hypothetical protein